MVQTGHGRARPQVRSRTELLKGEICLPLNMSEVFGEYLRGDIGDFSEIFIRKVVVLTYRKISGLGTAGNAIMLRVAGGTKGENSEG